MGYCQRKKYQRANFFIERNAGGSERADSKPYAEAEYAHDKRRFRARERRVLEVGGIACAEPKQPFHRQRATLARRGRLIGASLPPPRPEPSPRMPALEIRQSCWCRGSASGASPMPAFPSALDAPTTPRTPLATLPRPTRSRPRPVLPSLGRLPRHKGGAVLAIARAVRRRRMARSARYA